MGKVKTFSDLEYFDKPNKCAEEASRKAFELFYKAVETMKSKKVSRETKEAVSNFFSKEFNELVNTDIVARQAFNGLQMGISPYKVIEEIVVAYKAYRDWIANRLAQIERQGQ